MGPYRDTIASKAASSRLAANRSKSWPSVRPATLPTWKIAQEPLGDDVRSPARHASDPSGKNWHTPLNFPVGGGGLQLFAGIPVVRALAMARAFAMWTK